VSSPDAFDDANQLVPPVSVAPGQVHKLSRLSDDQASLGSPSGDRDAAATPELEKAFVAQLVERAEHGVGVHPEHRGKIPGRRQPLPRISPATWT
jgi:hypothetical protein